MSSRTSLSRRLALPLCLSLLAHGLLFALISLVPRSAAPAASVAEDGPAFSIRLASPEQPRHPPTPPPAPPGEEPWESVLVNIQPAPGGNEKPNPLPAPGAVSVGGPASLGGGIGAPSGGARGLLQPPAAARRIVYLLDRSMSMGPSGALAAARREIADSLRRLPPSALFQVIPYNRMAEPLDLDGQANDLAPAAPAVVEQAIHLLDGVLASGPTDHARAIRRALILRTRPDLLFLVTDAGDLEPCDLLTLQNLLLGRPVLHVVELSHAIPGKPNGLLARLAEGTGGSYRRIPPDR